LQLYGEIFSQTMQKSLQAAAINKENRDRFVIDGSHMLQNALFQTMHLDKDLFALLADTKRLAIVARSEFEAAEIDLDEKHAHWDFNVFERGANLLSAPAGMSAVLPTKPSKASSALQGGLQGAGAGAAIGSVVPGIGTALGAAAGALIGGAAGFLS
jgi:hypothetical protein